MLRLLIISVALCSLGGCATVTRGTTDDLVIDTTPAGAQVRTSNGMACDSTPCTLTMSRKSIIEVDVTKAGYLPARAHVTNTVGSGGAVGFAGNVLVGGIPGMVVDGVTGATLSLTPNPVHVTLAPLPVGIHVARPGQAGS